MLQDSDLEPRGGAAPSDTALAALDPPNGWRYIAAVNSEPQGLALETNGPLGLIWVGIGLACFFAALIWLNALLGIFLTPLFLIPQTWILEKLQARKQAKQAKQGRSPAA